MITEKSCGAVLFKNIDKKIFFLIVKYKAGHWSLVKGHVEKNETEKQTAIREIFEETGIKISRFLSNFKNQTEYRLIRDGKRINKTVVFFLAKVPKKTSIKLTNEHVDYAWLESVQAIKLLTYKTDEQIIFKAEEYLKKQM